jgi:NAD(P)H-quinone oxidoreductase subunit 5
MYFTELLMSLRVQLTSNNSNEYPAMNPLSDSALPIWQAALLLGPALLCCAAALFAKSSNDTLAVWRFARWAALAGMLLAGLSLVCVFGWQSGNGLGLRADAVGAVVLLLVAFVGWVIVRYSQPYLNGEHHERHYVRWLMTTLTTVGVVVVTNNVLVLALAWTATSLALHRLLTFYGERPPAVVAAHKKFIVARLADLLMMTAAALLYLAFDTLHIDQIGQLASSASALPLTAQAAIWLIACAALLKCAQLPFHGWLIQVMEAPTPVSALLHAGVVNLGGFVLMRFAPLVAEVPSVQVLLVVAGTATAVLAALVMTTRISIKVMLAWSTCAQMGFMLMQCGLGAWEMALLHLVAHSLYKAHAFLGAGGAVRRTMLVQLTPQAQSPGFLALVLGAMVGIAMTLTAGTVLGVLLPQQPASPAIWVLAGIVAFALVPLLHGQSLRLGGLWLPALGLGAFGVALAYFGLHALFSAWVLPNEATPPQALWMGVACAFFALFMLQSLIQLAPQSALARSLYPWFYGGLFLDEKFNRIAFGLWQPPGPTAALLPLPKVQSQTTSAFTQPTLTPGERA